MSISDGSDRTFFCRKMEKTRSVREEMDGRVFMSRQNRHPVSLINNMIKVLFPICILIWRVNNYVSRQGKVEIGEIKVQVFIYINCSLSVWYFLKILRMIRIVVF